ncbi:EAL domain-containing protein [Spongiibacter sp. IMCC21906]|uniref:EAL domain-containing protein n=1 Tax=Spongiibacter sp. IMCC21906 TaxID=1620392 RepID=UPI00062DE6E3|nr:EAL domain-containing protein [Spongiibacter sp. IMCC21906]AKH69333.1 EAL domain-containing protein [Spongiibacter sp. IMCC21906]
MATDLKASSTDLQNTAAFNVNKFDLSFSPIVDMQNGRLVALEAFARQQDRDYAFSHPVITQVRNSKPKLAQIFIDSAIAKVFAGMEALHKQNEYTPIFLSLHTQDINRELIDTLQACALQSEVPLSCLVIGICLPQNGRISPEKMRQIQTLKRSGVALSVQHSEMNKIPEASPEFIPLDLIKLNQSVLIADAAAGHHLTLSKSLNDWSKSGCYVVFDGINDAAAWQAVASLGNHFAQGALVSPPLLSNQLSEWRRRWPLVSSALGCQQTNKVKQNTSTIKKHRRA